MSMKKIMTAMMALLFGLSLGLYGETTEQEAKNLQNKEQHQNRYRHEKGNGTSGEKIRSERSNQGEASKLKNRNRERVRKETRAQAKSEAKRNMKAERSRAKSGR